MNEENGIQACKIRKASSMPRIGNWLCSKKVIELTGISNCKKKIWWVEKNALMSRGC